MIKATTNQQITRYYFVGNISGVPQFERRVEYLDGTNMLGVIFFAILIGIGSSLLDDESKQIKNFFKSINDLLMICLRWFILIAPIGVCSLIIEALLEVQNISESFKHIGLFAGICMATLIFYGLFVLSVSTFIVQRKNPFRYYKVFFEPFLLSFAVSSDFICIDKGNLN